MHSRIFIATLLLSIFVSTSDNVFAQTNPIINEALVHPSSGNQEWVEFYVQDGNLLEGYWVDDDTDFADDSGNSAKKAITGSTAGSDSHHVIFTLSSSIFNNGGDSVALFTSEGELLDHFTYAEDPGIDMTYGRSPDGTGTLQLLANPTKGSANSGLKPTETPTPTPTAKPTKAPTATKTPKATQANDTNGIQRESEATLGLQTTITPELKKTKRVATNGALPTAILRASSDATVTTIPKPTKQLLVEGVTSSPYASIAMVIGGLLTSACGILIYLKRRKKM